MPRNIDSLVQDPEVEVKKTSKKTKKRLNIDLPPESYELLQQLADESGRSMTEVLRMGLALYNIADEEAQKGRSLAIIEGKDIIEQISRPTADRALLKQA
jgi:uncharacterized protein (DUF1778 family)